MKKLILFSALLLNLNIALAQWSQSSGIPSGTGYALGATSGRIWAGTNYGVYTSTNTGTSFVAANSGISNPNLLIVWEFVNTSSTLFAGTTKGVYTSTNSGTSWTAANSGLTNSVVISMVATGGSVFAGTSYGGVFLSSDNGGSWSAVSTGLTNNNVRCIYANGGSLYVGTDNGVFISTNNGSSWTSISSGLGTNAEINALAFDGTNIYAGTNNGGDVYVSSNNGASWTQVTNGLVANEVYDMKIQGNVIFAATNAGVAVSTNNALTWTYNNTGLTFQDIRSLLTDGSYIYAGAVSGGVYKRLLADFGISGIKEENLLSDAAIFPNPNNGTMKIDIGNKAVEGARLNVYTIRGEKIYSEVLHGQNTSLDLGSNKGVFFMELISDKGRALKKIVVE
ncbi:MAG: T9SS type A sorting domain-containing protein [Bacteroidia bacterium]